MENALDVAIALACEAHRGKPYILHPLRLMLQFDSTPEQIVAVLHDVVEDSSVTLERLRELGFQGDVVDAIDALSRREEEPYDEFIEPRLASPLATRVKIRDIENNLKLSRLARLTEEDLRRVAKYHHALMRFASC